jgi:hypothetical protein
MSFKGFGRPPKQDDPLPHNRIEFVQLNWDLICTLAWQGFLDQGRGLVIVQADRSTKGTMGITSRQRWLMGSTPGFYIGEQNPLFKSEMGGLWPDSITTSKVAQYDPQTKFLCLFDWGDEHGATVQGFGHPLVQMQPPAAHARLIERIDDFLTTDK